MSRYIDEGYVKAVMINDRLRQGNAELTLYMQQVERQVSAMPSIDIVRCKECKNARNIESEWICEHLSGMVGLNVLVNPDDFCSYGVKKGADDE